mgnify:CR=1 FL=1
MKNLCLVFVFIFIAFFSCKVKRIRDFTAVNYSISDTNFVSNDLDSLILPYKVEMDSKMNKVIGYSSYNLTKYEPESPLGNFVADVVFESGLKYGDQNDLRLTKTNSLCLINFGGLRAPINNGDITIANIYELMPFDNEIVIVKIMPEQVKGLLSYLYHKNGQPISNAVALLKSDKNKLDVGGKTYDFESDLYVVTSDYLAAGGDKMDFFKSSKIIQTGILMRDALLDYVKVVKELPIFEVEGRVQFIK